MIRTSRNSRIEIVPVSMAFLTMHAQSGDRSHRRTDGRTGGSDGAMWPKKKFFGEDGNKKLKCDGVSYLSGMASL